MSDNDTMLDVDVSNLGGLSPSLSSSKPLNPAGVDLGEFNQSMNRKSKIGWSMILTSDA